MKISSPVYRQITPLMGELSWNFSPCDELLELQVAWIHLLKTQFAEEVYEIRQGFTAIGITWKEQDFQQKFISQFKSLSPKRQELSNKVWEIPVCYESPYGSDLGNLALAKHMRVNELIELHSKPLYRIHFFGFLPGFMYLNGLPEILHMPRKAVPDRSVFPGSVAIGGAQTGIYPMESPGGWHVVGRTPLTLFDPHQDPPVWASVGDRIQFVPISSDEMSEFLENPIQPTHR